MKILKIQALRGPNIWSIRRKKLIQVRLDLEEMEKLPSNKIEGFSERLEKMLPSLFEHRCSYDEPGGFFQRVREGTWMGHILEHVALEIQSLAGMETGFGRTRETKHKGIYNTVFSYVEEKVGIYAAEASLRIVDSLAKNQPYNLEDDIQKMRELREQVRFGPSTGAIVDEAVARDIPFIRLNRHSLVQLGYAVNQTRFRATITNKTSSIAVDIAGDKDETKNLLKAANIPVADGDVVYDKSELDNLIKYMGYPLVFKPINGNHGKGATINVLDKDAAYKALEFAQEYSKAVMVERFVTGFDFRILVINNHVVAAAKRTPAHVVGDGKSTIKELVEIENKDPRRGYGHENVLTEILIDNHTLNLLEEKELTVDSVLSKGEICHLKSTANLSTGGTSADVTDLLHPYNIFLSERISRIIGLDICGIDIMAPSLTQPLVENGGVVLEVNAAPGFRMHLAPSEGLPRNVAAPVLDMLYPPGKPSRIPIIAITGTNGKTTTTRLIAHIIKNVGYKVGFTTTDGIYIQNRLLEKGDCTGPVSAEFILKDPTVEYAVLETARGGILRAGLGFSRCDAGVITNIEADHLGLQDIETVEDLAKAKAVVVESIKRDGYAVLNAEDKYCVKIAKGLECNVAFFALDENNKVVKAHCRQGGIAAIYENGYITIKKGDWKIRIDKVSNIPLTFGGKAMFNIANVLAASMVTYLQGVKIEDMRQALATFTPSPAQTPGRLNVFQFKNFKVILDFAHNPPGYIVLKDFLDKIERKQTIGIISGTGDRRDEDMHGCGELAAQMFDQVIIYHDEKYLRGRTPEELKRLLTEGIQKVKKDIQIDSIEDEMKAVEHAMKIAKPGTLIILLVNAVSKAIEFVQKQLEKEVEREMETHI